MNDYYEILGLSKEATQDDIKNAYRKLALKYHPDNKINGCEAKFKVITEAYSYLSDSEIRARYNIFGNVPVQGSPEDIIFAFPRWDSGLYPDSGEPLWVTIYISNNDLEIKKDIVVERTEVCLQCFGRGTANGKSKTTCRECNGTGFTKVVYDLDCAHITHTRACNQCKKTGKIIELGDECVECKGTGRIKLPKTIEVIVPAKVENGSVLCLEEAGNLGKNGGPRGDIFVTVLLS